MISTTLCIPTVEVTGDMIFTINEFILSSTSETEVVIVMDGGKDEGLLEAFYYLGNRLRVFKFDKSSGPATARNFAAQVARGKTLVFADSDVRINTGVFNFLNQVGVGKIRLPSVAPQIQSKVARFFSALAMAPKLNGQKMLPVSACFSILRSDFLSSRGFNENFRRAAGEDWEFFDRAQNLGLLIDYDNEYFVFHRNPITLLGLARRSFRYAFHGIASVSHSPAIAQIEQEGIRAGLVHLPLVPLFVVTGLFKILLSTLSLGEDRYFSSANSIASLEKRLLSRLGLKPARKTKGYSKEVSAILSASQALSTESTWNSVAPYKKDAPSGYGGYRALLIYWRIVFLIGLVARLTMDLFKSRRV